MARRGRPRKQGVRRENSGRVQREDAGPTPEALDQRHRAMCEIIRLYPDRFAKRFVSDPDASWYIGRLHLVGEITQPQRDAAAKWLEITRQYEAMLLAPKQPGALDMNKIRANEPSFDSEEERRKFRRLKAGYNRRWELVAACGHDVLRATTAALRDAEAPVALVRQGLAALVRG